MSLEMRGICKAFDANIVLREVDFTLADGEIRALIGENGAGKTTLMNILGGVLAADAGEVRISGAPVRFLTPRESLDAGVAFIHQELNLINDLAVYENLFIGRELKKKNGLLDADSMCEKSAEVLRGMGIELDPRAMVRDLDASYKQVVEIARALLMRARIIIMDEPTTSLTDVEIERVFAMMRQVSAQGVSIVFISHKLGEVLRVCETYTVLRDGRVVAEGETAEASELTLAHHMVGHAVGGEGSRQAHAPGDAALTARGLSRGRQFRDVNFCVRRGEIVGFTGLLGDGRSELFRAIFGGLHGTTGVIEIAGKPVAIRNTTDALRHGLGYVPRNRKENGIVKDMSILENASLVTLPELRRGLLLDSAKEHEQFQRQARELHIKFERETDPINSLSGGNQQKVVLAKWLSASPRVMIFDNPTQGVDVGAKEDIYDIIDRLAGAGVAVIVLSSEAQEIVRVCDRTLVMYHGEIRGELSGEAMNEHNIMVLATGGALA